MEFLVSSLCAIRSPSNTINDIIASDKESIPSAVATTLPLIAPLGVQLRQCSVELQQKVWQSSLLPVCHHLLNCYRMFSHYYYRLLPSLKFLNHCYCLLIGPFIVKSSNVYEYIRKSEQYHLNLIGFGIFIMHYIWSI